MRSQNGKGALAEIILEEIPPASNAQDFQPIDKASNSMQAPQSRFEKASFLSKVSFSWLSGIVSKSRKADLTIEDLDLPQRLEAEKSFQRFNAVWQQERRKPKPSLVDALKECYWKEFAEAALFKFLWSTMLMVCAFFFVRSLVSFVDRKDSEQDDETAYNLCAFFFLSCLLLSMAQHQMLLRAQSLGVRVRAALMTAVYRKALKIERADERAAEVLNLVSNDSYRLLEACTTMHSLWSSPVEALAIVVLLCVLIGYWGVIALGLIALLLILQIWMAKRVAYLRNKNIAATDVRVRVMAELLGAMKLIKLYAWEDSFLKEVRGLRKKEVRAIRAGNRYKSWNLMSVFSIPPIIALVLFSAYVSDKEKLPSTIAFTTLSLFNTLRFPLVILPKAIKNLAESKAAVRRLQKFLLESEVTSSGRSLSAEPGFKCDDTSIGYLKPEEKVVERGGAANVIVPEHTTKVLHSVNCEVRAGQKAALVGPVGSGKSSLLLVIMGEARVMRGEIKVGGSISYCPQNPWIMSGTIRENILFGKAFDEERYHKVVYACALTRDFEILPQGDETILAEKGINLSGGQRQRICLARAVYADADLVLLDNPLSAVDWHTANHIMEHCIHGMLRHKTVIMATHQVYLLDQFDAVIVVKQHTVPFCGPYDHDEIRRQLPEFFTDEITSASATNAAADKEGEDKHKESPESESQDPDENKDSEMVKSQTMVRQVSMSTKEAKQAKAANNQSLLQQLIGEVKTTSSFGAWYANAGVAAASISVLVFLITQTNRIMSDWWIQQWSKNTLGFGMKTYNAVYGGLVAGFIVHLLIRGFLFYKVAIRAASLFHNAMYAKVMRAPMSFFSLAPLGQLLNAFSKDQDTIDEGLPDTMHLTFIYGLILTTTVVLVCAVLPLYTIVGACLLIFTLLMVRYYVTAAMKLRLMVNTSTSPVFSHLSESLRGIVVVRAFNVVPIFESDNVDMINENHKAVHYLDCLSLWLAFRLDIMGSLLVFATALFSVSDKDILASTAGLAVSNSLQALIFYTWMVRGIADIAALFNSVERVQHYIDNTPSEADAIIPDHRPADNWPQNGEVVLQHVQMKYLPWLKPALRGVSITIRPREKIGVVGRTGSGKSSLIMALWRMYELFDGKIIVDGVEVGSIGLSDLRSRLSIIPQEPVMFHGSIRSNLDPFNKCTEADLWHALEIANLKDMVMGLRLQLESPVEDNGENFSLGQRQLICLARAFLSKSPLLCLDEATAAMDLATDAIIQRTIREHFQDRTIVTIAHRIDTIIHSDRILAMDEGKVVEFDTPFNLLSNSNSFFSKLLQSAGAEYASNLRRMAFERHQQKLAPPKEEDLSSRKSNSSSDIKRAHSSSVNEVKRAISSLSNTPK